MKNETFAESQRASPRIVGASSGNIPTASEAVPALSRSLCLYRSIPLSSYRSLSLALSLALYLSLPLYISLSLSLALSLARAKNAGFADTTEYHGMAKAGIPERNILLENCLVKKIP